eukprot:scaffold202865_cov31-Tisochrysis_lutea.AAC.1
MGGHEPPPLPLSIRNSSESKDVRRDIHEVHLFVRIRNSSESYRRTEISDARRVGQRITPTASGSTTGVAPRLCGLCRTGEASKRLHASMGRRRALERPFGGCPCCVPGGLPFVGQVGAAQRNQVVETKVFLSAAARLAFLMGSSNASVPRLAEECVEPMRCLPREVLRRIFDLCIETVPVGTPSQPAGTLSRRAPQPPPSTRHADGISLPLHDPRDPFTVALGISDLAL